MNSKPQIGPMLRLVLGAGALLQPLARPLLKRRLSTGKEDPQRWLEKLGMTQAARQDGPLIWLHGVGVGEVMALRGLIAALSVARPDLNFLVTSSARSSGDVFAQNLPPKTQHQYLPLDLPKPVAAFLDHWRPDLAVWSDQEVWPRLTVELARRGVPQTLVAARITDRSAKAKTRFGTAYGDLYRLLDTRHAQDAGTAAHLAALMGDDTPVHVTGSLKAAGSALAVNEEKLLAVRARIAGRKVWLLASSHPNDEAVALAAHSQLRASDPDALLIIVPRDVTRADQIAESAQNRGLTAAQCSTGALPDRDDAVFIADSYGVLGLWYRIAPIALIGGTFDSTNGHNPWEPAALGAAILHGPHTANFSLDFKSLSEAQGCLLVRNAAEIVAALNAPKTLTLPSGAHNARAFAAHGLVQITDDMLRLLDA